MASTSSDSLSRAECHFWSRREFCSTCSLPCSSWASSCSTSIVSSTLSPRRSSRSCENRESNVVELFLVLAPLAVAALAYTRQKARTRSVLLVVVASLHTVAAGSLWLHRGSALGGWLMADDLGLLVLTLVSVVFLVVS